jgi:heme-degrading monooxygenase HmoA
MIVENARIDVKPGSENDFEAAVAEAAPLFRAAKGCHGVQLQRGIENPSRYWLIVQWETLEDHTVTFRSSEAFTRWRALAGPYFAGTPEVQHVRRVQGIV